MVVKHFFLQIMQMFEKTHCNLVQSHPCLSITTFFLGASSVMYACSICKATFKSTKTRHHHMKTKHNVSKVASSKTSAQQVKQCIPIITPISISESSLLQVGPHGPLQKVDANIDTEQIDPETN